MKPGVQHELCARLDCAWCDVIVQCSDNQEVPTIHRVKLAKEEEEYPTLCEVGIHHLRLSVKLFQGEGEKI